jgi:hypothetical protein
MASSGAEGPPRSTACGGEGAKPRPGSRTASKLAAQLGDSLLNYTE